MMENAYMTESLHQHLMDFDGLFGADTDTIKERLVANIEANMIGDLT